MSFVNHLGITKQQALEMLVNDPELMKLAMKPEPEPTTWMYAIQVGEDGPIKLGVAKSPRERLATLQVGNHAELRGLGAWRIWVSEERDYHDRFAEHRIRGEWFHPHPDIFECVQQDGEPYDWGKP